MYSTFTVWIRSYFDNNSVTNNNITMNKRTRSLETITIFLAGVLVGSIAIAYSYHLNHNDIRAYDDAPTVMWNDDWESIPMPGELVEVEVITQDTIYIGPLGE